MIFGLLCFFLILASDHIGLGKAGFGYGQTSSINCGGHFYIDFLVDRCIWRGL